ncbi:MAG TPA: type VI secretion system membrane subunit TssM [Planctomycetota bacterium]
MKALLKQGGILIVIPVLLLVLVWYGGGMLGWDAKVRGGIVMAVVIVALVAVMVQKIMAVRGAALIENQLKASAQEQVDSTRPDKRQEVMAVKSQLDEALGALRASKLGKGALYALPWYMIIGPPGSGKSTALLESGLNFPHVSAGGKGGAVKGVGGTRNCDWWFTDEGILLDTAGRYTTELDDRQEWLGFLDLLKRARKRKPMNGAIVAVSIPDLLGASEEELERHAKTIRDRLDELTKRLELVFPVYLMFTKLDLLHGFTDFFEDFAKADRAQVWGCTFPYSGAPGQPYREIFEKECRGLFESLCAQRLGSLAAERPSAKKQSIFMFPLQFERATRRLADFVGALFRPNPFQESAVFRGFYFTSGTQEGTPIDQVIRSMSQAFGLAEEGEAAASTAVDKKSYFINHLFTKIIFPDQVLARTSARVERRRRILKSVSAIASIAATVALVGGFAVSFLNNRSLLSEAAAAARAAKESERAAPPARLEALERLRVQLEDLDRHEREGVPLGHRWGLYKGDTVAPGLRKAYFETLRPLLVAPAADRVHQELKALREKQDKKTEDYESLSTLLQVYETLSGDTEAVDVATRDLVVRTLSENGRWTAGLGADAGRDDLKRLAELQLRHLAGRLERAGEWRVSPDRVLMEQTREALGEGLWPLQSFGDILNQSKASVGLVSGEQLIKGKHRPLLQFGHTFSSLFSQQGWNDVFQTAIESKTETLDRKYTRLKIQNWPKARLGEKLKQLYANRLTDEWGKFLDAIDLAPFPDLQEGAARIKILAGPESPLAELLQSVWKTQAVRVGENDVRNGPAGDLKKCLDDSLPALDDFAEELLAFVRSAQRGSRVIPSHRAGKLMPILDRFNGALRRIDAAVKILGPDQRDRFQRVLRLPLDHARQALAGEAQEETNQQWAQTVHKTFVEQLKGKYPFDDAAAASAPLAQFSRLFNPKSGAFWTAAKDVAGLQALNVDGKPLVSTSREFQSAVRKAETFRDLLYPKEGEKVAVKFWATLKQRKGVQDVKLRVGAKEFSYYDTPDHRGEFAWTEGDEALAKFSIFLPVDGTSKWYDKPEKELKDDWALARLLASGDPKPEGEKGFLYSWTFKIFRLGVEDAFQGDLVLEAEDRNPVFGKKFFPEFACPDRVGP